MHRNDSAAARKGGADALTLSGEKATDNDHQACEGPRAAILAEKNKKTKQRSRQGKVYRCPSEHSTLTTPLMSHWERKESGTGMPFYSVFSALEISLEKHFAHALD